MIEGQQKKILKSLGVEHALFTYTLELVELTPSLKHILALTFDDSQKTLYDLFPEFFGLEDQLGALLSGKKEKIFLPMINKYNSDGQIIYLDITLVLYQNNILALINNSTEYAILKQKNQQQYNEIQILKETIGQLRNNSTQNIWGVSKAITDLKKFILKVADLSNTTILLTGQSGTGKTLVARSIHEASCKANTPFVEINCAAIPETLIESEIFGHVKGAFTSAIENKKGLLEEADGGTLFLDEIGELPISVQPKFLTFLETKKYRPVGSTKEISVDVRIIAATNRDLKKAIKNQEFREDLYYRINVVSLQIPALAERDEDVLIISENLIKLFAIDLNKKITGFTDSAKEKIKNYNWPGNIRELKNILERSVIFCENELIDENDLIIDESDIIRKSNSIKIPDKGISLEEIEKEYLVTSLKNAKGNQTKAAKLLGLSLDTFRYRIKKYNLS